MERWNSYDKIYRTLVSDLSFFWLFSDCGHVILETMCYTVLMDPDHGFSFCGLNFLQFNPDVISAQLRCRVFHFGLTSSVVHACPASHCVVYTCISICIRNLSLSLSFSLTYIIYTCEERERERELNDGYRSIDGWIDRQIALGL